EAVRQSVYLTEDVRKIERAEVCDEEEHREQESEVADAVDDEGLLAGIGGGVATEIEADQQVGSETDALPSDEEQLEARREHQNQHEEHEEVEVREEAPVTFLFSHVANRVDVNQEADTRDDAEHDQREVVDREGEVHLVSADGDPWCAGQREVVWCASRLHVDPQLQDNECGDQREEQRDGRDKCARKLAADSSVDKEAGEGESRDEPEQSIVHAVCAGSLAFISACSLVFH